MRLRLAIFATLGIALALYLLSSAGWHAVLSAAIRVGWGGFALLCVCSLGVFLVLAAAWYVLEPRMASYWVFVAARMVRDSVAEVLPFSQLGGIALGVRAAIVQGAASPLASASMIVDVTTEMLAQVAYALLGLAILSVRVPRTSQVASLTTACLAGLALAAVAAGLFIFVQRRGERVAAKIISATTAMTAPLLRALGQAAAGVGAALDAIHRSPLRIALSAALHLAAWIASAIGPWLAFRLMGARLDLPAVIAIESLVYALRSAAVLVPNALGVQEAAYALLGPLFGVGADVALAVSVLKRARDVALGVPVLLLWQAAEGRRALTRLGAGTQSDGAST
jgi:glycosyltransferase 2 family protein